MRAAALTHRLSITALCVSISLGMLISATCGAQPPDSQGAAQAPVAPGGAYDPLTTFAPMTLPDPVNAYRAGSGAPGPDYWQNRADYVIHASLDPEQQLLSGSEVITYTNNSPQALEGLWVQLEQNTYRADARARYARSRLQGPTTTGLVLDAVQIERQGHTLPADYLVSDTRMQIHLAQPLAAHGGKLAIRIRYHYTIPGAWGGRTGHMPSRNGEIYAMAQWYPRMAVFDDVRGWDTLPYLGTEFYLEYGDFDYFVTVPWDMLVAGSGELQNPQVVLTTQQLQRLRRARTSESTVSIRSAAEVGDPASRPVQQGTLTWHFHMNQTRDVSFAASRAFIWDAARAELPNGGSTLAMAFYPVESAVPQGWGRTVEYIKDAVQNFSRRWAPYPYPAAIAVACSVSGMEYPGIVFDNYKDSGVTLFWLTAHEIGHTWFPMMVGFNERRDEWMDEGFNSFIDVYESQDFDHGVYAPKHDQEFAPGNGPPADQIAMLLEDPQLPIMLTRADQVPFKYGHPLDYFKSAFGLVLLREQILGPQRFDWAFRKFIRDWTYRHPTPSDFFRAMDSAAGEDLSWFWRGWYLHNWTLDLAVRDVRAVDGDWHHGAVITIANLDPLVLPAAVKVDFADGTSEQLHLPAETWIQQGTARLQLPSTQPVSAVTIDPDHLLPDRDRSNNVWKAAGR